jgi:iron complex outermembrane receptor protein
LHTKVRLLASGAALFAVAFGTSVHAQTKPAAAAAASNTIEELVVTAEKRSQSLQDIPVAISAFTSQNRDLVGINTIQDMTNFTPGLNYSSQLDRASLRGVGRLTNAHPIATAVAVYDDGIFTTSTVTAGKTPIFTDRVEVLRGPQGTLYGRNSLGGAINVISRHPTEEFYAEVRGTVANYGRTLIEGAVSGPLAPDLQFRLAGNWEKQRDGYFKNIVPGMPTEGNVVDQYYVEGQLQAKFGEHADGWMKVAISGWNNGGGGPGARAGYSPGPYNFAEFGSQNVNSGFACAPGGVVTNVVNASPLGCVNPASTDPRKFASLTRQSVSLDDTYIISGTFTYHFDGFDVKYIGGGNNYDYTLIQDNGGGSISSFVIPPANFAPGVPVTTQPCPATNAAAPGACPGLTIFPQQASTYREQFHNISHEFDFSSSGNGAFQWLGGLYYYREGYKQPVFTTMPGQPQLAGAITAAVPALTGPVGQDFQNRLYDDRPEFQNESYAAFGQIDWKFTDTLKATLGLRWSHDRLFGSEAVRVICFATQPCGTTPQLLGQNFTPAVDVTAAVVYLGGGQGIVPKGVVANGHAATGGVSFTPDGFAHRSYDASWEATTGTAGLQWEPDHDTLVYGRYSRGYKEGGFAVGVTSTEGQFPYTAPEHINDYEFGIKKDFGRKLQTNLALFYYDYSDLQAPLTVANNTGGLAPSQSQFLNVPKAVSEGVELETTWAPIDNLRILFNYSFNATRVTRLSGIIDPADPEALQSGAKPLSSALVACTSTNPAVAGGNALCDVATGLVQRPQNLSGNALPQAPRNKIALNVIYTWDFEKGSLTPSVSYTWRDKEYSGIFQRSYDATPTWDQVDARVTWKDKDNKYSIIAYVKNAFDRLGYDGGASGSRLSGAYPQAVVNAGGAVHVVPGLQVAGTPSNVVLFNGVLAGPGIGSGGIVQSYNLTPPRTFGVEFQYRF